MLWAKNENGLNSKMSTLSGRGLCFGGSGSAQRVKNIDVEALVERLAEIVPILSSTWRLRQDFREEVFRHTSLSYLEDASWPGLGAVR